MTDRILDFSENPARLNVRLRQLVVQRREMPDVSMPLADLAVLIVSHPQVSYTQAVLAGLAEAGGAFIACNRRHLPVGMFLPLVAHHAQTQHFAAQARVALPVQKRLWRQVVRAKIKAQAETLEALHGTDAGLRALVGLVRSGDPANVEARAARRYWPVLFADTDFRRHRENEDQNLLLNYGYAVLRAIVARAVCGAGLHPSLGIHHHNRYDAYCLADDLMEPFRPTVDRAVAQYVATHEEFSEIESAAKQEIIGQLTGRYVIDGQQRTLFDVVARLACSLADVFLGNAEKLELPDW
ncbi:MAG TPA: type II CRISPR-associated endonuclease Cas1 [Thermoguttaceae bacterium]|nr:type II CRISPR-associated endonuclease Cas1 [Thermoguttaceae bacterium]